jgi:predicted transcriptional regulator
VTYNIQDFERAELHFPGLRIVRPAAHLSEEYGMATLTIRLPDEQDARLRQVAQQRKTSLNKLMEELAMIALTEFDAETWFRVRAARGSVAAGARLLDKLDAVDMHEKDQEGGENHSIPN